MSDKPEEGFTFRDRRRVHLDESPPPVPEAAPAPAPAPVSATDDSPPQPIGGNEKYTLPDVRELLMEYLLVLRDMAVLRLGLAPNPATGQSERDLEQARIAIDTVSFLASQVESLIPLEDRLSFKAMLSDLQLHYVRLSGGA